MSLLSNAIMRLREVKERRQAAADTRAQERLARARTELERIKIRTQLQQEKLALEQEMYGVQAEVKRSEAATREARRAAGGPGIAETVSTGVGRASVKAGRFVKDLAAGGKGRGKGRVPPIIRRAKPPEPPAKRHRGGGKSGMDDLFRVGKV